MRSGTLHGALASVAAVAAVVPGCGSAPRTELLLLVTVDTLRADYLGAYGSDRGLTPSLDALARESEVFLAAYAPASFTLPSVAALHTGRYPEALGISRNESAVPDSAPTLAVELRERGWRTAAVVSNFVLRASSGLDAGFDVYDDDFSQREATRRWPERAAADTTDAALRTLDACFDGSGAPCFLWVHYQDPHGPYTPPPGERARWLPRERAARDGARRLPLRPDESGVGGIPRYQALDGRRDVAFYRAGYAAEVHAADAGIGRLLDGVAERGLLERAVVVFAADHGEGLGEDDYWFAHGEYLNDPLVRVPLFVRVPGRAPRAREDVVALVDVYPTLLQLLAGAPPRESYPGRDLLAEGASERASTPYLANLQGGEVPRYGIVKGGFVFVTSLRDGVWDGRLTRRGGDATDLRAAAPQVAAALRRDLERARRAIAARPETPQELSPADRDALRALGYAADPPRPD